MPLRKDFREPAKIIAHVLGLEGITVKQSNKYIRKENRHRVERIAVNGYRVPKRVFCVNLLHQIHNIIETKMFYDKTNQRLIMFQKNSNFSHAMQMCIDTVFNRTFDGPKMMTGVHLMPSIYISIMNEKCSYFPTQKAIIISKDMCVCCGKTANSD